jgi:hypothetical protein
LVSTGLGKPRKLTQQPAFLDFDSDGTLSRLPTTLFNAVPDDFNSTIVDPSGNETYEFDISVAS